MSYRIRKQFFKKSFAGCCLSRDASRKKRHEKATEKEKDNSPLVGSKNLPS
jgi:hypothetical protein